MKNDPLTVSWFLDQVARANARHDDEAVRNPNPFTNRLKALDASLSEDLDAYRIYMEDLDRKAEHDRVNWSIGEKHQFALPSDPRRSSTPYSRRWR